MGRRARTSARTRGWSRAPTRRPANRLLANDPHLAPSMPSVWYQVGLHCRRSRRDCPFDVAGFSFSGVPGVVIGHNDRIAWGFTNLGPDVTDLYLEKVTGNTYEYDGKQEPLAIRHETIKVAGGRAGAPHRALDDGTVRSSPTSATAIAASRRTRRASSACPRRSSSCRCAWTALDPGPDRGRDLRASTRRTNWASFRAAAASFEVPAQNLVYADVDGNIGYQAPGLIPFARAATGTVPVRAGRAVRVDGLPSRTTSCRSCSTRRAATSSPPTTPPSARGFPHHDHRGLGRTATAPTRSRCG